jgi:hypothetical protein
MGAGRERPGLARPAAGSSAGSSAGVCRETRVRAERARLCGGSFSPLTPSPSPWSGVFIGGRHAAALWIACAASHPRDARSVDCAGHYSLSGQCRLSSEERARGVCRVCPITFAVFPWFNIRRCARAVCRVSDVPRRRGDVCENARCASRRPPAPGRWRASGPLWMLHFSHSHIEPLYPRAMPRRTNGMAVSRMPAPTPLTTAPPPPSRRRSGATGRWRQRC